MIQKQNRRTDRMIHQIIEQRRYGQECYKNKIDVQTNKETIIPNHRAAVLRTRMLQNKIRKLS